MELKEYQQKALDQLKNYLQYLSEWQKKAKDNPELELDFTVKAWDKADIGRPYFSRKNGIGEYLPNFCLKIPTGGGKTLLAVRAIDLINSVYLKKKTGLILWVVPTNQIYKQTIKNLKDRAHYYRQYLDIASGGRTMIVEKTDHFTPLDVKENLVVLMLMLPSASRQSKETLKVFKDNGGFQEFFPTEEEIDEHKKILKKYSNLDVFGSDNGFWGKQIKTSLGNTLRTLSPVIILDEGHKAYSDTAQDTLRGFNPSIIVELSATPTSESNILVDIKGIELSREDMIKLDLHIINKASPDWKDTLNASIEKNNLLQKKAKTYESNTGNYIRPICLIQAERTGKDQRGGRFIHSEDVREYLIKIAGVPENQVAVTSAELKEIEGVDLFSKECPIRYIITKQALQEGWDCSFAYILTVLTNPNSKNSMTQLVGRILRQPFARKTKIKELDESYVFTFQQKAANLLSSIKDGFEEEGLGDLSSRIVADEDLKTKEIPKGERVVGVRAKFKTAASQIMLPVFAINDHEAWRTVDYDMDILSRIKWEEVDLKPIISLPLSEQGETNVEVAVGIEDSTELITRREVNTIRESGIEIDPVFLSRHLLDIVPNPWTAYILGEKVINGLLKKHDKQQLSNNFVFIIEEMKKHMLFERDRLAEEIFAGLLDEEIFKFIVVGDEVGYKLPKKKTISSLSKTLTRSNGLPLQCSLFDFAPEDEFNTEEKNVTWYLEEQEKMFFWYRNISRQDYSIQGWKKSKIYPDFIFTLNHGKSAKAPSKIFVMESKGIHLKNEDTAYKQSVFGICNDKAKTLEVGSLGLKLKDKSICYEVVFGDEWQKKINEFVK